MLRDIGDPKMTSPQGIEYEAEGQQQQIAQLQPRQSGASQHRQQGEK